MDISVIYIKMCAKAGGIQKNHSYSKGDYFLSDQDGDKQIYIWGDWIREKSPGELEIFDFGEEWETNDIIPLIWLPRQEDLQKMIGYDKEPAWHKVEVFNDWCQKEPLTFIADASMEQLWLGFVMVEKYQKVWVNGEWVKRG